MLTYFNQRFFGPFALHGRISNRLFCLFALGYLLAGSSGTLSAQNFHNEWIDFSAPYKKLKIGAEGIYRIGYSELNAMGFGSVQGSEFQLIREGVEVPIFASTNGVMGAGDYIEFYATEANGKMDTELYLSPDYQPNIDVNIISDTSYYFLTFHTGSHLRFNLVNNAVPSPAPTPAPYCWATAIPTKDVRTRFSAGKSYSANEYFHSSDFDQGEGYSYNGRSVKAMTLTLPTPAAYTGSVAGSKLSIIVGGYSNVLPQAHHLTVKINNGSLFDTAYSGYNIVRRDLPLSPSQWSASNTLVSMTDNTHHCIYKATIRYPRLFDFSVNFTEKAAFELPAGQRYIEITSFNTAGGAARLYDIDNNKIYTATATGGVLRFYLDADAGSRKLFLTNATSIESPPVESVQFRDYSQSLNQGDYIILTNSALINASPSYVNDYKNYRSSVAGGSHKVVVVDVAELYNQFGYGYEFHPLGIRKFIGYALANWTTTPEYLFIIGKGLNYHLYRQYQTHSALYDYVPIPTWGDPGSDNLFSTFDNDQKPRLATGRFSAWNNNEVGRYLEKVKKYEQALKSPSVPTVATEFWKKRALHIAGATDLILQNQLVATLDDCAAIYSDTLIGGVVTTIKKNSSDPVSEVNNLTIDSIINNGLNVISFYGHASSSGFDYNLNNPDHYQAAPRFPVFLAFGCDVAQIYTLGDPPTISEQYVISESGGCIAMIAENNYGYISTLPSYMRGIYQSFSFKNYGMSLGKQYQKNISFLQDTYPGSFMDIHTQCLIFQGDPALHVFNPAEPDFAVETAHMSTQPANVSTASDSFTLKAVVYNIGKAVRDSVWVVLTHTHPGSNAVTFADSIRLDGLLNSDTLIFQVPVDPIADVGMNNYTLTIDADEAYEEISEQNNKATIQVFIFSENLVPVYPHEFAIVHDQGITLKASTLNAFAGVARYRLEIDTTAKFNSAIKQNTEIVSSGGVIKWKPPIVFQDSVVYYWRAAVDSLINGAINWTTSSFIYLANGSDGWNQSHVFQYQKDAFSGLGISETSRRFRFDSVVNVLRIEDKVIYPAQNDYYNVRQSLNDVVFDNWGCGYTGSVQVVVIDSVSGLPWHNTTAGLYGSIPDCHNYADHMMFEFKTNSKASRDSARVFIESVPDGNYIMIKNLIYGGPPGVAWDRQAIAEWMADTLVNGSGISLYHAIKNLGFNKIDEFTSKKVFAFFRKKGDDSYPIYQKVSPDSTSKIEIFATFLSYPDTGKLSSTVLGPATKWKRLKWETKSFDNAPQNDSPYVVIYGINTANQSVKVYQGPQRDTSLTFIDAATFPRIRMVWNSVDNLSRTSPHLQYWRVLYDPVPEAALNAAAGLEWIDSLKEGASGKLKLTIENISPLDMDSMLVRYRLIDANNLAHDLKEIRYRPLPGGDTLHAELTFNADAFPGNNFLFIEANPDFDQPEQYHPNNLGYLPLHVTSDKTNPILDVTFDGVHILDKDIVSAKPLIKILLKDESTTQALNDTALMQIGLIYPDQSAPVPVPIDGNVCKFFPAHIGNKKSNEARIEFRPELMQDGVYTLIVSGKDKAGNIAGNTPEYRTRFTVENKPSITNVLNYPNPFSTATQFIFTLTGSEIPSQFKIQILTVTGKVVREITKEELGHLHIGRNMTEYRWDGRDQYGQLLGNGVYLYRVVTSLSGKDVEHRVNATVDKYFKNGYGKLYIMR